MAVFSAVVLAGTASPAVAAAPAWRLASISPTTATSVLRDVAAADARHAWAVGLEGYHPDQQGAGGPLMLRWNGKRWSRTSLPTVPGQVSFEHVATSSAQDVWVAGVERRPEGTVKLVWRYDGSTWTDVPYPPGTDPSLSVQDLSAVDGRAWLVGYRSMAPVFHEWTGSSWVERPAPNECVNGGSFPNFCTVNAVKAFAPDDVWAAGNGWWNGYVGPVLFHWNGTAWRTVDTGLNGMRFAFRELDGLSSKDIWAIGGSDTEPGTLVVRGDGTTWQTVAGPNATSAAAVAVGSDGVPWVAANYPLGSFSSHGPAGWTTVPAPVPAGTHAAYYNAVAAVPGTNRVLAVGSADVTGTSPLLVRAVVAEYR
ncbi:hypothetical protein [Lentzea sp. NPDC003310]|uniref:hypothetical protein n=1 Tax=Lentzea sp. NPDC003310 TaxID=3154447 RepID=UPI0033ACB976